MKFIFAIVLLLLANQAYAGDKPTLQEQNLIAAMSQITTSIQLYADDMNKQLAAAKARIDELVKQCGEACQPK